MSSQKCANFCHFIGFFLALCSFFHLCFSFFQPLLSYFRRLFYFYQFRGVLFYQFPSRSIPPPLFYLFARAVTTVCVPSGLIVIVNLCLKTLINHQVPVKCECSQNFYRKYQVRHQQPRFHRFNRIKCQWSADQLYPNEYLCWHKKQNRNCFRFPRRIFPFEFAQILSAVHNEDGCNAADYYIQCSENSQTWNEMSCDIYSNDREAIINWKPYQFSHLLSSNKRAWWPMEFAIVMLLHYGEYGEKTWQESFH